AVLASNSTGPGHGHPWPAAPEGSVAPHMEAPGSLQPLETVGQAPGAGPAGFGPSLSHPATSSAAGPSSPS
ncbi:hypothetical protein EI555_003935, partial [Monodon monoceros]